MTYTNYNQLRNNEKEGEDYQIRFHERKSGILMISPHGGCIEPGTTEMAYAVAGKEYSFYSFEGLKNGGNRTLHITSTCFDEPIGLKLVKKANSILAIHGCRDVEPIIYLGGKDEVLREEIRNSLEKAGIQVGENPRFPGLHADNICNRSFRGMGVQMEISLALRKQIFDDLRRDHRKPRGEAFDNIIQALRRALANYLTAL